MANSRITLQDDWGHLSPPPPDTSGAFWAPRPLSDAELDRLAFDVQNEPKPLWNWLEMTWGALFTFGVLAFLVGCFWGGVFVAASWLLPF